MSSPNRRIVTQAVLEQEWGDLIDQGIYAEIIMGDPKWDFLLVASREVARAPKPVSLHV